MQFTLTVTCSSSVALFTSGAQINIAAAYQGVTPCDAAFYNAAGNAMVTGIEAPNGVALNPVANANNSACFPTASMSAVWRLTARAPGTVTYAAFATVAGASRQCFTSPSE